MSGTVALILGERALRVEAGQAVEFSTMIPHAIKAPSARRSGAA
nr:hypothetical protein [Streptomyces botrytidirepellens]